MKESFTVSLFLFGLALFFFLILSNVYLLVKMKRFQKLATTSKLGLLNLRGLHEVIRPIFGRFKRRAIQQVTVAVLDVDDLKALNTALGYRATDAVLARFGEVLEEVVRDTDVVAHIHGDEFAVVFTDTSEEIASGILERAKARFARVESEFLHEHSSLRLSFSYGLYTATDRSFSFLEMFDLAERALKRAKERK